MTPAGFVQNAKARKYDGRGGAVRTRLHDLPGRALHEAALKQSGRTAEWRDHTRTKVIGTFSIEDAIIRLVVARFGIPTSPTSCGSGPISFDRAVARLLRGVLRLHDFFARRNLAETRATMGEMRINVAICLDARMLDAAIVFIASVKAHARTERPVRIFAVTDFESIELAELANQTNDACIEVVLLPCTNVHGNFPIRDHITAGTYLRFLLPDLLPDIGKIIYLDVDIVVNRNLETLFDTPLNGLAMAAMPDWPMLVGSLTWPSFFIPYGETKMRFATYAKTVLDVDCDGTTNYFNCGVMLFDLACWRAHNIAGRTIKYLTEHPGLYYMDQDALNAVIAGRYVRLDARYNSFASCSFSAFLNVLVRFTRAGRRWEAMRAVWRRDPWIVHYAGANKPWNPFEAATAHDALWWHYVSLSPMRERLLATFRQKETAEQRGRSKVPASLVKF